jgi:hypothetical protein
MGTKAKKPKADPAAKQPAKSRARTPPFANYPAWSTAKFWGFIRSGLRGTYNKWPPKWDILNQAKRPYKGPGKQQKWEYQCNRCKKWHKQKDVSVDHKIPAGALNSFEDVASFVERLFVGPEGLQLLCSVCHSDKTQEERKAKE